MINTRLKCNVIRFARLEKSSKRLQANFEGTSCKNGDLHFKNGFMWLLYLFIFIYLFYFKAKGHLHCSEVTHKRHI